MNKILEISVFPTHWATDCSIWDEGEICYVRIDPMLPGGNLDIEVTITRDRDVDVLEIVKRGYYRLAVRIENENLGAARWKRLAAAILFYYELQVQNE